jgi:ketosteroid isomerase-like protein
MPEFDSRTSLETADRLFRAVEAGDVEALRSIYADDAVIWHNTDGKTESREQNLETLLGFVALSHNRTYTEIRREPTPRCFVRQHVLRAQLKNGRELVLPACIICEVRNERITRLDEYFDTASLAALRNDPLSER